MACSANQLRDQTIPALNQSATAINTVIEGAELLYRIDQRATLAKARAMGFTREEARAALLKRREAWDALWVAFDQATDTHAEIREMISRDDIDQIDLGLLIARLTEEVAEIAKLHKARRAEIAGVK